MTGGVWQSRLLNFCHEAKMTAEKKKISQCILFIGQQGATSLAVQMFQCYSSQWENDSQLSCPLTSVK